jgi:NDP-sugar pyrophosphorylase family protein
VIVAVVPAAGHATRLRGLVEGSKELLEVEGRPLIEHLLGLLAPADEVRVVVRPAKEDLVTHLRGRVTLVEGEPETVAESIGLGLAGLADDDVVLLGFPDTLFGPPDAFERLVAALREPYDVVLGAFTFAEPWRSDVLALQGDRVKAVEVRPAAPGSNVVWGCFAARRWALRGLERHDEPGRLLAQLAAVGKVGAVRFGGGLVDFGTPEALAAVR